MKNLSFITCDPRQAEQLVGLGINGIAFMWHERLKDPIKVGSRVVEWETAIFRNPKPGPDLLPAYTKQELDAMIGPDITPKPDFYPQDMISKATDPLTYPVMLPATMHIFSNGAHASAEALIYLLTIKFIDPVKVNERYLKMFP